MKPELRPGFGVRKAGRPDSAGSTSMAMRRSASEPISQTASAIMSAAKATGSAWKLPPDSASSVVGEDQRIVGDAVGLDRQRRGGLAQQVERGAHHLRLAAQAIGVLHARRRRCRCEARIGAAGHQRAQRVGRLDLAAMAGAARGCADRTARRSRVAASVDSAPVTSAALEQRARPRTGRPARRRSRTACR